MKTNPVSSVILKQFVVANLEVVQGREGYGATNRQSVKIKNCKADTLNRMSQAGYSLHLYNKPELSLFEKKITEKQQLIYKLIN